MRILHCTVDKPTNITNITQHKSWIISVLFS